MGVAKICLQLDRNLQYYVAVAILGGLCAFEWVCQNFFWQIDINVLFANFLLFIVSSLLRLIKSCLNLICIRLQLGYNLNWL